MVKAKRLSICKVYLGCSIVKYVVHPHCFLIWGTLTINIDIFKTNYIVLGLSSLALHIFWKPVSFVSCKGTSLVELPN